MFMIVLLLGAATLFYVWLKWNYSFWKRHKVPGPEPRFIVGNIGSTLNFSEHFGVVSYNWYNEYANTPYVGYYKMLQPSILVRDPEIIKDMTSTNFNSFRNNDARISKKYDSLTATNPFFKVDDEWREARKTISPMFSQMKLKGNLPVMNEVAADFVKYIQSYPPNEDFDAKDISNRFTTQNVMKCGYSIDAGCFNEGEHNEFLQAGKDLFAPSLLVALKFLAILLLPQWVLESIPASIVPPKMDKWFRSFVTTNKKSRSKDFQSNDLFQTLLQIEEKNNYDETFLAGHSISFFIDGTETSGTSLSFALYELARNPQCQETLYDEIKTTMAKYDGELTYEAIQEMKYLEGVILEASRINPPVLALVKLCTKRYTLPKISGQLEAVTIEPGTVVQFPIWGIHMDPKYYPNPEEFQPERFSEEEQRNRQKCTFLTFGEGPRICIGMRFALLQIKVALVHLTLNFRIKRSPKQKPIVIDPQSLITYPRDGIFVQFEAR